MNLEFEVNLDTEYMKSIKNGDTLVSRSLRVDLYDVNDQGVSVFLSHFKLTKDDLMWLLEEDLP